LRGRRDIATSTSEHIEQYLSEKSTRVSRQSLRHVVAQLWAFCRYGLASGLVRNGLDVIDSPRVSASSWRTFRAHAATATLAA